VFRLHKGMANVRPRNVTRFVAADVDGSSDAPQGTAVSHDCGICYLFVIFAARRVRPVGSGKPHSTRNSPATGEHRWLATVQR